MTAAAGDRDPLFSIAWVHVFEEDTAGGAVYRPEDADIPLSRRPRARLALEPDGSARVFVPGPDDRFIHHDARWSRAGDALVIQVPALHRELSIVDRSPERLVVQVRNVGRAR